MLRDDCDLLIAGKTFAMNVSQIYDADDEPVEMKIELEKAIN